MKKSVGIASIVAIGVVVNLVVWLTVLQPARQDKDGLWAAMETVTMPPRPDVAPAFPDALRAQEGRRISLSGVAFLMSGGVENDRVRWCVLMPPSRYGCCGTSCDPRPELSVYVDCSAREWPADGRQQVLATVEGTLRLERGGGSWCLYTLEDADVRPMDP